MKYSSFIAIIILLLSGSVFLIQPPETIEKISVILMILSGGYLALRIVVLFIIRLIKDSFLD